MFKHFLPRGSFASAALLVALSLGFASGCGPGFDPGSEVKTLRVLALQKDAPYPTPGQSVNLSLLWDDAKGGPLDALGNKTERPIQLWWAPPCENPGNDLYYACFPQFAAKLASGSQIELPGDAREHSTHVIDVPGNIIEGHSPAALGTPTYGLVYSFFALCAGKLAFEAPKESGGLPVFCKDGDKYLGPDDFVVGYAALYVFENAAVQNHNPALKGLEIEGTAFHSRAEEADSPVCIGRECVPDAPLPLASAVDCDKSAALCYPTCDDDGGDKCPDIHVRPLIDPPAERDDVSALYYGRDLGEQLWLSYYSDSGKFSNDTRLLNDAQRGWNDDVGGKFRAPKTAGPVTLWVVVHDNRGGVDWARVQLGIR